MVKISSDTYSIHLTTLVEGNGEGSANFIIAVKVCKDRGIRTLYAQSYTDTLGFWEKMKPITERHGIDLQITNL